MDSDEEGIPLVKSSPSYTNEPNHADNAVAHAPDYNRWAKLQIVVLLVGTFVPNLLVLGCMLGGLLQVTTLPLFLTSFRASDSPALFVLVCSSVLTVVLLALVVVGLKCRMKKWCVA
jgi:hypothetical protein